MSPALVAAIVVALLIPILPNLWAIWNAFHSDFASCGRKDELDRGRSLPPRPRGTALCFLGQEAAPFVALQR